jgi:hypothetical protein
VDYLSAHMERYIHWCTTAPLQFVVPILILQSLLTGIAIVVYLHVLFRVRYSVKRFVAATVTILLIQLTGRYLLILVGR